MQYLFLAGRVLYGGFFLLAGIDHFRHVGMMTPYAAAKGIPAPRLDAALHPAAVAIEPPVVRRSSHLGMRARK